MTDSDLTVCVVGAGAAGAGVSHAVRGRGIDVTVLEKSRGVGGRAATRRRDDCRYDHGANYVKDADPRTTELIERLGAEGRRNIVEPVWTFDAAGEISEGRDEEGRKWTWVRGITQLSKRLFGTTDVTVRKRTRVASLREENGEWTPIDTDGRVHGPFDAVVLTPPAPQTAELLATTDSDSLGDELGRARGAVEAVPYRTIRSIVLHYPFAIDRPYYALVNTDREHPVGWISREECKPGHVPDEQSLLIVQMSPDWSTVNADVPLEAAAQEAAGHVADVVGEDRLGDPDWVDGQEWLYALPDDGVDNAAVEPLTAAGLFVVGDWVAGEGRVHAALRSGIDIGERLGGGP